MKDLKIAEPTVCPYCGYPVTRILDEGAHLYCTNPKCPEVLISKLNYFVSKDCMNIDGLSEKTLRKIVNTTTINSWKDLYFLSEDRLRYICNLGDKTSRKIVKELENSKTAVPAWRVLVSMGIPFIGQVAAKKLLSSFKSIKELLLHVEDYTAIESIIGPAATESLVNWLKTSDDLNDIIDIGLQYQEDENTAAKTSSTDKLSGYNILATGTLKNFSRDEIKESVIANGGNYASGVNKKLDLLIVGEAAGESKLKKANELGIKQITEEDYLKLIS